MAVVTSLLLSAARFIVACAHCHSCTYIAGLWVYLDWPKAGRPVTLRACAEYAGKSLSMRPGLTNSFWTLKNQGEKSIDLHFIMVPFRIRYAKKYSSLVHQNPGLRRHSPSSLGDKSHNGGLHSIALQFRVQGLGPETPKP